MRWYIDRDDIILSVDFVELRRKIAAMSVEDKKTIYSFRTAYTRWNKDLLKLFKAYRIRSLSLFTNCEKLGR
jgi:hypothetical protein